MNFKIERLSWDYPDRPNLICETLKSENFPWLGQKNVSEEKLEGFQVGSVWRTIAGFEV